jgi:glutathione peroxidase
MTSTLWTVAGLSALALVVALLVAQFGKKFTHSAQLEPAQVMTTPSLHHHRLTSITGQPMPLSDFSGKAVLLVNVASRCGFTGQYTGLQSLYQTYQDRGLVILGIPANDFGAQEPGTEQEIQAFCSSTYNVTFPMSSKLAVTGPSKHPLYTDLTSAPAPLGGEVGWNFTKFLLDRHGRPVARFGSSTKPNDPKLIAAIEAVLSEP